MGYDGRGILSSFVDPKAADEPAGEKNWDDEESSTYKDRRRLYVIVLRKNFTPTGFPGYLMERLPYKTAPFRIALS
jgi:hypothetical protein